MTYAEKPHLLVVDDDDRIRALLLRYLDQQDYVVATAANANEARELLAVMTFDLMVLDVMMPGMSGVELAHTLRAEGLDMPILLLTAMGDTADRIAGLEAGADDYLVKPFEPRELHLRVQAILRRKPAPDTAKMKFRLGPWVIDLDREDLLDGQGSAQKLTSVEIKLLRALSRVPGTVMAREELARLCGVDPDERTIDVQITRLRRKLDDDPKEPRYIMTVRGQGYQMMVENFEIIT